MKDDQNAQLLPDVDITVVVPAYRPESWVDQLLGSLAAQQGCAFHTAISIDQSDDEAEAVVRQAVTRHLSGRSVSIISQRTRLGWVENVNALLRQVETRFVCVLPQDDYVGPHYLALLRAAHDQHPEAAATYPDISYEWQGCGRGKRAWKALWRSGPRHPLHRWRHAWTIWREGVVLRCPSLQGEREARVRAFLLSHFSAVTFRGMVDTVVMGEYLPIRHGRDQDFAADTLWMLAMVDRGPIIRVADAPYHKCIHTRNTHTEWHCLEPERAWRRWLAHCQDCHQQLAALGWPDRTESPHFPWLVQRLGQAAKQLWPDRPLPPLAETTGLEYQRALTAK